MMVLPGKAAAEFRLRSSRVLVRYLGGDPSLVDEIVANRFAQHEPAQFFQEAVAAPDDTEQQLKHLQLCEKKLQVAQLIRDSTESVHLLAHAERLVKEATLPCGTAISDYIDAATYLRERGYSEYVNRLAGELGKALAHAKGNLKLVCIDLPQCHGPDEKAVGQYHRRWDAMLLDEVFESFKQGDLFKRVVSRHRMRDFVCEAMQETRWSKKRRL
jgi:hypothetical protein